MKKKSKRKLWLHKTKKRWLIHGDISIDKCDECKGNLLYFYKYDAHCCPHCNCWLDDICGDINCDFCKNRPETPDMGLYKDENRPFDRKILFIRKYSHRLKRQNHRTHQFKNENTKREKL